MTETETGPLPQPSDLTNDVLLQGISETVGDVTKSQVAAVIAAWWALREGDSVGTIRRDPETGAIAVRVSDNGLPLWRVSVPNGEQYNDAQPTLPWPILGEAESKGRKRKW